MPKQLAESWGTQSVAFSLQIKQQVPRSSLSTGQVLGGTHAGPQATSSWAGWSRICFSPQAKLEMKAVGNIFFFGVMKAGRAEHWAFL